MASLTFKYLTETKYKNLPDETKELEGVMYMVRGKDCNAIYNKGVKYASDSDIHVVSNEQNLPVIGEDGVVYVTKTGSSYIWNDAEMRYIVLDANWDVINGGDATEKEG